MSSALLPTRLRTAANGMKGIHADMAREAADEIELARAALIAMVGFTKTKVAEGMVDHAPELEAVRTYLRHNT